MKPKSETMAVHFPKKPIPTEVLAAFLARTVHAEEAKSWILRGSVVTRAHHPEARAPMDLDYLWCTPTFDPSRLETDLRRLLKRDSTENDHVRFFVDQMHTKPIWADTEFPGLRAMVPSVVGPNEEPLDLGIDFGFGDPMVFPATELTFHGVGPLRAVARETMVAWKVHGLVEWGRGRWRPKDLSDLNVLLSEPIDEVGIVGAIELAFSSRRTDLSALADLLFRPSWGESGGRLKRWRSLGRAFPGTPEFGAAKARVIALLVRTGFQDRLERFRHVVLSEGEAGLEYVEPAPGS